MVTYYHFWPQPLPAGCSAAAATKAHTATTRLWLSATAATAGSTPSATSSTTLDSRLPSERGRMQRALLGGEKITAQVLSPWRLQGGSEKQRRLQGSGFVMFCAAAAMCDLEQWQLGCSDPIGAHPLHTLQFGQISVTAFFSYVIIVHDLTMTETQPACCLVYAVRSRLLAPPRSRGTTPHSGWGGSGRAEAMGQDRGRRSEVPHAELGPPCHLRACPDASQLSDATVCMQLVS